MSKTCLSLSLVSALICSIFWAENANARYAANAFDLRDDKNNNLFTNRDLQCVSLRGQKATFTLNHSATRFFYEFTKNNVGKEYRVSLCGGETQKVSVHSSVYSGQVQMTINPKQAECLETSFKLNEPCSDCPVCKN